MRGFRVGGVLAYFFVIVDFAVPVHGVACRLHVGAYGWFIVMIGLTAWCRGAGILRGGRFPLYLPISM